KSGLMRLLEEFLKRELASMLKDGIRLRAIGDLSGLPKFAQKVVEESIEKTKHNKNWNLTLALNYGSRQEVLNGIHAYANKILKSGKMPENLDWPTFANHLETKDIPDPDLIIRTSGEFRLSNFLLLQAAYAEIFVSPLHWPDFNREAFIEALKNYIQRERRFGQTSDQISHSAQPLISNNQL
ncbi:MAG: di-trans,poly-cis-decaprenylcistransferase, partial [Opitutae bacterium]|nr:di-trans,poly-cis-decaprenylcistransferase [Opitutae bacterium]